MKAIFRITVAFIALAVSCPAWAGMKEIYLLRVKSNDFIKAKVFDSASVYLSRIVQDPVYANAVDYMNLACCRLHVKDTAGFKRCLTHSIEKDGADTAIMRLYFRSLDAGDLAFFKDYANTIFPGCNAIFMKMVDTTVAQEMKEIAFLDQVCRKVGDKDYPHDTAGVNFKCIRVVGHYIDSVNFVRVADLIRRNKFPGYHNFGINSAEYDAVLMHVSDIGEEQWNFIYDFLKKELASGDIMQSDVIAIATRHYRGRDCTYYGTQKWGLTMPCDCEHVDKIRAEIGLDSLKEEYERLKQTLPDCYKK